MNKKGRSIAEEIEISDTLIQAVLNQGRIDEVPHNFYKYPARFSPVFAREAINVFTKRGDTVMDPFCGGGTSLVEAILLGRKAAGFDISSLAVFLTRVKTSPLSIHDKKQILNWISHVELTNKPIRKATVLLTAEEIHYHRNLPVIPKNFFETILNLLSYLPRERQRRFVRLVLLAVGQWALDCKTEIPSLFKLQNKFSVQLKSMLEEHYNFLDRMADLNNLPKCYLTQTRRILNRSSESIANEGRIPSKWLPAKLILTSPPYPGVHVVYHRWQINGRKETPAPFWLTNSRDGAGEAYYCLGRRGEPELKTYYERLQKAFFSIRSFVGRESIIVQLVAFSDPSWQLSKYLNKMEEAGFRELKPVCDRNFLFEDRIWRNVPGRKWYSTNKGSTGSSHEVLLLHKPIF